MSSDIIISAHNLCKTYRAYAHPLDRLIPSRAKRCKEFHALRDVSVDIRRGETVGIIGRNGSGKSTLLQLICGIRKPTSGTLEVQGRISALLELGAGFHPEFTGRENIFMQGAIMGVSREEMEARFDDIAAFADIGEYIEQPVKTYSSGMFVRLAFAVNIMTEPEIMIIDEALSVGDISFRAKCMTALARIQEKGATILFVSHDIDSVKSLCSHGVYLDHGQLVAFGSAAEIADHYVRVVREEMSGGQRRFSQMQTDFPDQVPGSLIPTKLRSETEYKSSDEFANRVSMFRYGTGEVKVVFVELLNMRDEPVSSTGFNQQVKVHIYFESNAEKSISVNLYVLDEKRINITGCGFSQVRRPLLLTKAGERYLVEYVFHLPLQEGNYSLQVQITAPSAEEKPYFLDVIDNAVLFQIREWEKAKIWSKVHLFPEMILSQFKSDGKPL
jgi:lipopolysaccharide transport system ATP-binding protein